MFNIGIVGFGFVGQAVCNAFNGEAWVVDPAILNNDISDFYNENRDGEHLDVIFICVPTPMLPNGDIDASIVQECVKTLLANTMATIVIKSTVTPNQIPSDLRVVYNPEFLTEANAEDDFIKAKLHVLGGERHDCFKVWQAYRQQSKIVHKESFVFMTKEEASLVKYAINSFLATKITFFNQLYDLVDKVNGDYDTVLSAILYDDRISSGHTSVADNGRKRGFGGSCLPKDVNALYNFSDREFTILKTITNINNEYRSKYLADDREKSNNIKFN